MLSRIKSNRVQIVLFVLALLFACIPFLTVTFYNHPSDDDFSCSILGQSITFQEYFINWYLNHTGRYTAVMLWYYPNPMNYSTWLQGVRLLPLGFFAGFFVSLYIVLYAFLRGCLAEKSIAIFSMALGVLYLFATPLIASAFYWFMAASVYMSGCIFFLLSTASIIFYFKASKKLHKIGLALLATLFIIATMGCNESILTVFLVLLFLVWLRNMISKDEHSGVYTYFFVVGLIAAFLSLLAPGNTARANTVYASTTESVFTVAKIIKYAIKSLYYGATHLALWSNNTVLWLASILFIPLALTLANNNALVKKYLSFHPILYVCLLWLVLSASAFIPFLGTGDALERVWNSSYLFFLFGWFAIWQSVIVYLKNWFVCFYDLMKGTPISIAGFVLIFLLFAVQDKNINMAYVDLFAKAPEYDQAMQKRYEQILLAKERHSNHCEVSPLFEKPYKYPKTLFLTDLTTDPAHWINKSYSAFFSIDSIYASHDVMISRHEQY